MINYGLTREEGFWKEINFYKMVLGPILASKFQIPVVVSLLKSIRMNRLKIQLIDKRLINVVKGSFIIWGQYITLGQVMDKEIVH